jgi:Tol biopolymer transport system component
MIVRPSATGRRRVSRRSASFGWSPRSNALALQSGDGVFLVPLRGRGSRRLGSVPAECRPVWSPNARWISCLLSVLSTTGRKARQIPAGGANLTSLPSWSPGGAKLVYGLALDDSEAASHVYTVHADGSGLRRLTGRGIQEQPHWSPDGLRIAYDCGSSLCVMSADGSAKKRIVSGPIGPGISWLPDGTSLAFVRRGNVWVTGVDGSDLRQLTRTPGDDDESAFQPA